MITLRRCASTRSSATETRRASPVDARTPSRAGLDPRAVPVPVVHAVTALAINILIYGPVRGGLQPAVRLSGLLSFGHAAFLGAGGYFAGIAIVHAGVPWWAAIAIGVLGGGSVACSIGVLATRTRGIYFAMVTLALAQCVYYVVLPGVDWTGGENGLRGINVREINIFGLRPSTSSIR